MRKRCHQQRPVGCKSRYCFDTEICSCLYYFTITTEPSLKRSTLDRFAKREFVLYFIHTTHCKLLDIKKDVQFWICVVDVASRFAPATNWKALLGNINFDDDDDAYLWTVVLTRSPPVGGQSRRSPLKFDKAV